MKPMTIAILVALGLLAVLAVFAARKTYELRTEIHIEAPPEEVWAILTASDAFHEWNPFIHRLEGTLAPGETLALEVGAEGTRRMSFRPEVLVARPGVELRWLGTLGVRHVFDGEHVFELRATETGTQLLHWERFSGVVVPVLLPMIEADTRRGFEALNVALKARCEAPRG
jgi:hypothetical protein